MGADGRLLPAHDGSRRGKSLTAEPGAAMSGSPPSIRIALDRLADFDTASRLEWLETNGVGGWASSTVSGAHTRRYHGLLVAATTPPSGREVLLSRLDETIVVGDERHELGCNQFPEVVHPQGFRYLTRFSRSLFPVFDFEAGGNRLRKTVAAIHGENSTLVRYELAEASGNPAVPGEIEIEFQPFVAARSFHSLAVSNDAIGAELEVHGGQLRLRPYAGGTEFWIQAAGAAFETDPDWYFRFEYARERDRGLDYLEDLWTPGRFRRRLVPGERVDVLISTRSPRGRSTQSLFERERKRRTSLVAGGPLLGNLGAMLSLAADQFIVRRGEDARTVIAGYHWFGDWGRDTMIALPGLTLATGRHEDARSILRAFLEAADEGMLPNRFPDTGHVPEYNTVDATLWSFVAVYRYLLASEDDAYVRDEALPVLRSIVEWHDRGTRYGIHVAEDGLLSAGEPGVQLTWMDARVGDRVVTPRHGKPVEVNALWCNALHILAELERRFGDADEAVNLKDRAHTVGDTFEKVFWNEETGGLFDVIGPEGADPSVRPNQVIAIGLPFAVLTPARAASVLDLVERTLLTPVGLRSLSPMDPAYKPRYRGGPDERDGAYHQGTVWGWLIGPFVSALIRVEGEPGRRRARPLVQGLLDHLASACVGTCSEIFDGDEPHEPRGAVAQAWTVAELLRVLADELGEDPEADGSNEVPAPSNRVADSKRGISNVEG